MNHPIPPRPDLDVTVTGVPTSADGHPRSTGGWWEGIGFYIIAFFAGGIAAIPVAIALGNTSVNGAIGLSEIVQTIAAAGAAKSSAKAEIIPGSTFVAVDIGIRGFM